MLKLCAQLFAPKYSKAFTAHIFMKLTISQWHYVEIDTEIDPKRIRNVESTCRN
jgi:hypothetical protein